MQTQRKRALLALSSVALAERDRPARRYRVRGRGAAGAIRTRSQWIAGLRGRR